MPSEEKISTSLRTVEKKLYPKMEKSSVASSNPPAVSSDAKPEESRVEDRKPPRRMSETEQLAAVRDSNPEATRISKEVGVNSKDIEEDAHQQCGDDNWDISEQPPTEVEAANIKSDLNELSSDMSQNFSKAHASGDPSWPPNQRPPQSRDKELKEKIMRDSKPLHQNATHITTTSSHLPAKGDDRNNQKEGQKRRNAFHGFLYQLKLLMLFLHRGVAQKYSFRLSTEMKEAKKFDDLVFEYSQGGEKMYRFLQAKHKLDESKSRITADSLLSPSGDFSLPKYFSSYQDIKREKLFEEGFIKDVIICTNIDFDMKSLNSKKISIVEIKEKDDILDVKCDGKQPKRYKFREDVALLLKPCIDAECSDDEIKDFFYHLVFAVNQPKEEELGVIIRSEIGKEFDFITTENVYNKFFQTMLNWLQGKERGLFISYEEGKEFFEEARRGIPIWFGVRDPVASFVGRSEQLRSLHQSLQTEISQTVVVSGLGGVGKTELTRKYIKEHSRTYDNKVIWIEAENCHQLAASFRRLARDKLGISTKNANGEEKEICSVVEDVYKFFSNGKSLFIFDNAEKYKSRDEYDHGIDRFLPNLPAGSNRPHVLITSRNQTWRRDMKVLLLEVFTKKEAVEFIGQSLRLKSHEQTDDAKQLAETLQCLPLALQQAVAYIKVCDDRKRNLRLNFQINDYLKMYKKKAKELLMYKFPEYNDNDYSKTVFTTWNITLDAIKDEENGIEALEIIYIASYFAPENIPTKIFYNVVNGKMKLKSAVELLKQYSMVNVEPPRLNLHRLVQQVIRMQLNEQNAEEDVLAIALNLFNEEIIVSKYVDHAISAWNHSTKYKELTKLFFKISVYITNVLSYLSRFEEMCSFGLKASELLNVLPADPAVVASRTVISSNIALAFKKVGKDDMALQHCRNTYNVQKANFGENDYGALNAKRLEGVFLSDKGCFKEALKHYEEVLSGTAKIALSNNDPLVLATKRDVAQLNSSLGKHDVALPILKEVHSILEDTFGKDDADTLNTKRLMAAALTNLNQFDEALKLLREIYSIRKATLTKNHPVVLLANCDIARVLFRTGKVSDAVRIYEDVLDYRKDALREHHSDVLSILRDLAEAYQMQGKYDKALEILDEVIDEQRALGSENRDTLKTQFLRALTLQYQMNYEDALRTYKEVLSKMEDVLGKSHPDILTTKLNIAVIYLKLKNFDAALQNFEEVFGIQKREQGADHVQTLATESSPSMIYGDKNEYQRALKVLKNVYSELEKKIPNHPFTFITKKIIAMVRLNKKKYEEALKMSREGLEYQKLNLGEEHCNITTTKRNIAEVLVKQGKQDEALQLYREVFESFTESLGPDHPQTLEIRKVIHSLKIQVNNILGAVRKNDILRLKHLISNGGNVNTKNDQDRTLLHFAVSNGNANIVNFLLQNRADVTRVTKKGNTPLHIAALENNKKMIQVLLHHVSKTKLNEFINAKTTGSGSTSLHVAAKNGSLEVAKCLLIHGAMYNIENHEGETPFDVSNDPSVKCLLEHIELCFEDAREGNEIIGRLRALSSDEVVVVTNARDNQGCTLLQVSIINKHKNISDKLLINYYISDKFNRSS